MLSLLAIEDGRHEQMAFPISRADTARAHCNTAAAGTSRP